MEESGWWKRHLSLSPRRSPSKTCRKHNGTWKEAHHRPQHIHGLSGSLYNENDLLCASNWVRLYKKRQEKKDNPAVELTLLQAAV